jgi:hypothetical protein
VQSQQQQEFYRLTEAATESLNSVPESGSFVHVFSYWRLPAFDDQTRTTLYAPRRAESGKDPFVTVTIWRRKVDLEKLRDPVERLKYPRELKPTIEALSTTLEPDLVASVISDLSSISLPSIRPHEGVVGLDGIGYRFSFSQGLFSLDLSWWCDRPETWQDATQRIEEIVSHLENAEPRRAEQGGGGNSASLRASP